MGLQFLRRFRNTKIVSTLGPASEPLVESLFLAGVDVFRLNFSHGTHSDHERYVHHIREVEQKYKRPISILADLQGPKLRIGMFEKGSILLNKGQEFTLDLNKEPGNLNRVYLPHPEIFETLKQGRRILLDDGNISLRVLECGSDFAITQVINGGVLSGKKGVNLPDSPLFISVLSEKDKNDLAFALSLEVDWVALSFVQNHTDLIEARSIIGGNAKLIAKLERPQAIEDLENIILHSDGIMVARGDLGVEMSLEDVPILQKAIIARCRAHGKPVVVATQMLESMIQNPTPTRAEVSDVATAIYDGADAVMLSAETAMGKHPEEAVAIMDRIIKRVEANLSFKGISTPLENRSTVDTMMFSAKTVSNTLQVPVIASFTLSGASTVRLARQRPIAAILALTTNHKTYKQLPLVWGVHPVIYHEIHSFSQMAKGACDEALLQEFAKEGDSITVIAGVPFGISGQGNILHIAKIEAI